MRTTVSLDPDVAAMLEREARERGVPFKTVLNDAVRHGLRGRHAPAPSFPVFDMGEPFVPLDRALTLAGDLEDAEAVRRLALGK